MLQFLRPSGLRGCPVTTGPTNTERPGKWMLGLGGPGAIAVVTGRPKPVAARAAKHFGRLHRTHAIGVLHVMSTSDMSEPSPRGPLLIVMHRTTLWTSASA